MPRDVNSQTGRRLPAEAVKLWDEFRSRCESGRTPEIETVLKSAAASSLDTVARRDLLIELIKLDLEHRWRSSVETRTVIGQSDSVEQTSRLALEDYATRFPELTEPNGLPLDLIEAEYRVRHQWGDRPAHAVYIAAYPDRAEQLEDSLVRIDETLSGGTTPNDRPVVVGSESETIDVTIDFHQKTVPPTDATDPSSSDEQQPTRVIQRFNDYELLEEIARGGMGVVYKARQVKLNRTVAIKMILAGQLASSEDVARFYSEAEAAANLDHPGIVPIYEVNQHEGQHYFSMGYVDGTSLADRVKDGPLPPREAAEILRSVAEAVEYAHQHGVIHRDLKPSNILLKEGRESRVKSQEQERPGSSPHSQLSTLNSQPVVTDFGLAKSVEGDSGLTATGQVLGTPSYMPPEQAAGDITSIGPVSDVYSLGAVLYCLLCGRPPFQAANVMETLRQVMERTPASPRLLNPAVDRDLETICLKCLEKSPTARFSTAGELVDELGRFLAGEPIRSRRVGPITRSWRWLKRKPLVAALCASVLVLAAVVFLAVELADRAAFSTQLGEIGSRFDARLDEPELSPAYVDEMFAIVGEFEAVSPDRADDAREQLHRRLGSYVDRRINAPKLTDDDVARLESLLAHLAEHELPNVDDLKTQLQKRLADWQPIFRLVAPFDVQNVVFRLNSVQAEGDALFLANPPQTDNRNPTPRIRTQVACETHAQFEAVFDQGWRQTSQIGLMLNVDGGLGYDFVLRLAPAGRKENEDALPPAKSFAALNATKGHAVAQIRRNNLPLAEQDVPLSVLQTGLLRLRAERRRGQLALQINGHEPLLYDDPFPLGARRPGVFGVLWPAEAGIKELTARHLVRPPAASPLEQADDLYDDGRFDEALSYYRRQFLETEDREFRHECRYKQALCLLELSRPDEAESILAELVNEQGRRWPPLAGCQLWVLMLRQEKTGDAVALFESLSTRFQLGDLGALVPNDVREEILTRYFGILNSVSLMSRIDPQLVQMVQRAAEIDRFLSVDGRGTRWRQLDVSRAYRFIGELEKGMEVAAHVAENFKLPTANRHLSRMLRLTGQPEQARQVIERVLAETADNPSLWAKHSLKMEHIRVLAALERWEEAEREADRILSDPAAAVAHMSKPTSHFYLLKGFLREHFGDRPGAIANWREGYRVVKSLMADDPIPAEAEMVNVMIMGSLSGEMTDADASEFLSYLLSLGGRDSLTGMARTLLPQDRMARAVRTMWETPRGRRLAEDVAFERLSVRGRVRVPVLLAIVSFIRHDAFGGEFSQEQEDVLWSVSDDLFTGLTQTGEIKPSQVVQLGLTWKGTTNFLGWGGLAPSLKPDVRARLAYAAAHRYLRRGNRPQAEEFLRTAMRDAGPNSELAQLAQTDLDLITGGKGQLVVRNDLSDPVRIVIRRADGTEAAAAEVAESLEFELPADKYNVSTIPARDDWRLSTPVVTLQLASRRTVDVDWLWQPGTSETFLPGVVARPAMLPGVGRWQVLAPHPRVRTRAVVWSADGRWIACGSEDGLIRLYDAATRRPVRLLADHDGRVTALAFDSQSGRLLSGGFDKIVRVWEVPTGRLLQTLYGHGNEINDLAWNSDGKRFASADWDGSVRVWEADGTETHVLSAHDGGAAAVAFSRDGRLLASAGFRDRTVRLWNAQTGKAVRALGANQADYRRLAFSPDGNLLAVLHEDGVVQFWNTASWQQTTELKAPTGNLRVFDWHNDGRWFVCVGWDGRVSAWLEKDDSFTSVLETRLPIFGSWTLSPQGELVAAGSNGGLSFSYLDGRVGFEVPRSRPPLRTVAWQPGGILLAVGGEDRTLRIVEPTGVPLAALIELDRTVECAEWNANGTALAFVKSGGELTVWQPQGSKRLSFEETGTVHDVAWSPDGQQLAAVGAGGNAAVWNADGTVHGRLAVEGPDWDSVTWSRAGRKIAVGGKGGRIRIWDVDRVQTTSGHSNQQESQPPPLPEMEIPTTADVRDLAWSPDGRLLAGAVERRVHLWLPDGTEVGTCEGHSRNITSLAWAADGTRLASMSEDGTVRAWNSDGTELWQSYPLGTHLRDASWSVDGVEIATVGADGVLRIWNAETGEPLRSIVPLSGSQTATFSAGGELLRADGNVHDELVYAVEQPDGAIELLFPREFHRRLGIEPKAR